MLLKSHTLEFLLDAAKKNIKIVLCHFMPLIIGSVGKKDSATQKQGFQFSTFVWPPPLWGSGGRYQTNVNKGQVEEEDYLSYSKKTYLNRCIMIFLLVIKESWRKYIKYYITAHDLKWFYFYPTSVSPKYISNSSE